MLVLGSSEEGFADDSDPELRYRLPVALRPVVGPDGVPQVSLSRRSDGRGLFRLRLAVQWPSLGAKERPVPLSRGRFRLRIVNRQTIMFKFAIV